MFLPDHLAHDAENEFNAYGFTYKSMAHWIIIQARAAAGQTFKHYFDKSIDELPTIHRINPDVLKEGLHIMLPNMKYKKFLYAHKNDRLGLGTTKLRMKFGEPAIGDNLYGIYVSEVLKERAEKFEEPDVPNKKEKPDSIDLFSDFDVLKQSKALE